MLGLVFTEMMRFIEQSYSADVLDDVLDVAGFEHDGAYTSVGDYPHTEALRLVAAAAEVTGGDEGQLLVAFGRQLFGRFRVLHPEFFVGEEDPFGFMASVQRHIHAEVRKLHGDARPPSLVSERQGDRMTVLYSSHRPLALLAHGLVEGCIAAYGKPVHLEREDLGDADGRTARFTLSRKAV